MAPSENIAPSTSEWSSIDGFENEVVLIERSSEKAGMFPMGEPGNAET